MRANRLVPALVLAALNACPAYAQSEFALVDETSFDGQDVLHFRSVVLRDEPARPILSEQTFEPDTRYGLLPVGDTPAGGLMLVEIPQSDPPRLWIDANGDDRFGPHELYAVTDGALDIPVRVGFQYGEDVQYEQRTLLLRRGPLEGWQYALRGYRHGRLMLGPCEREAVLIDGDANGRFDDPGADRGALDLDGDGRFDPFLERFPLGHTLRSDDEVYAVRADRGGVRVTAQPRSKERGRLALGLPLDGARVRKFTTSLISDIGELVELRTLNEPQALPVGKYRFGSLLLELETADGSGWRYNFSGLREYVITITKDEVTRLPLPGDLRFEISADKRPSQSVLYDEMTITPRVVSTLGVYMTACSTGRSAHSFDWRTHEATITLLLGDKGDALCAVCSGFA